MQVGEYRVAIVDDPDPLRMHQQVFVMRRALSGVEVLQPDGTWLYAAESAPVGGSATLTLPSGAIDALIDAVDRYRGAPSHAKTEAAVLREWLNVERARVDAMFETARKPITLASQP